MTQRLLIAAGAVLACMGLLLLLVWLTQERMVFQPPRWAADRPTGVDRVDFTAPDGQPLFAYVVREVDGREVDGRRPAGTGAATAPRSESPPVLLVFHGNAEIAAWGVPWAREVARRTGATVVLAEYRGYAGLPGAPTYAASRSDALATWAAVRERVGAVPERTALYGHSLGSAVAAELAAELGPRALVLEAPFTSARAMAGRMAVPGLTLFWRALSRVHYDTRERVATLGAPVWVAHGTRDGVIPAQMGREVHAAARAKGELLLIPGAGHNDVRAAGGEAYWGWLARALGA